MYILYNVYMTITIITAIVIIIIISHSKVFLKHIPLLQLVEILLKFYTTQRFITVLTTAHHLSLS